MKRVLTKWMFLTGLCCSAMALGACGVDEAEQPDQQEAPPAPQKKEDAGVHVMGSPLLGGPVSGEDKAALPSKDGGAPRINDCEWWGCPPQEPCGDNHCGPGEQTTCPEDCGSPPSPFCGDGLCNGGESSSSCPADCGPAPQRCGDYACSGSETISSCPSDCAPAGACGNCVCEYAELTFCPTDCGVYIPDQPACPQE